ncbi:MAG: toll/interleukin-1 receptor domain-containing protein [Phycisphaerales bacterium]|nr:toll/interleukin-1 receptor domain-containing protein [Phycisphaerales bacterium]
MSQPHNVFISWAGEHARKIALILRDWLPDVCKDAKPWMSEKDIDKGADWSSAIDQTLATCKVCIVILTPESVKSHWVHFEAGALYKGLGEVAICTFLCGAPTPIKYPLAKFQRTDFNKDSVEQLTITVSERLGTEVDKARQHRAIGKYWPDLEKQINNVLLTMAEQTPVTPKSEERLLLEEILENTRSIAKKSIRTDEDQVELEKSRGPTSGIWDSININEVLARINSSTHGFMADFIDKQASFVIPRSVFEQGKLNCTIDELQLKVLRWAKMRQAPPLGSHTLKISDELVIDIEVKRYRRGNRLRCEVKSISRS